MTIQPDRQMKQNGHWCSPSLQIYSNFYFFSTNLCFKLTVSTREAWLNLTFDIWLKQFFTNAQLPINASCYKGGQKWLDNQYLALLSRLNFCLSSHEKSDCDEFSNNLPCLHIIRLKLVYTSGFRMRFLHCVAIFYYLPWLRKTKVSYKKSQRNEVNVCG